jgi:hypothetical protein
MMAVFPKLDVKANTAARRQTTSTATSGTVPAYLKLQIVQFGGSAIAILHCRSLPVEPPVRSNLLSFDRKAMRVGD